MKLSSLEITNLWATKHAKFEVAQITRITGGNGTGKTSLLHAFATLFEGGHDPSMIRKGCKKGIAIALLDNGATITKTVTEKSTELEIVDQNGLNVPSPRTFIKELGEAIAVDPGKLLSLDTTTKPGKEALIAELLKALPVEISISDIETQKPPPAYLEILRGLFEEGPVNLEAFGKLRKRVEETRRGIGVEVRDAEGTIRDLRKKLEDEDETDWQQRLDEIEGKRAAKLTERDQKTEMIRAKYGKEEAGLRAKFDEMLAELHHEQVVELAEVGTEFESDVRQLSEDVATLRERLAHQAQCEGARKTIDQMEDRVRDKSTLYERMSGALEVMDKAKTSKLEGLPVEFDGDDIRVDGVEWHNVNTARRVEIALQICSLRAGKLPLLVIDDGEHLDEETWTAIREAAVGAGFQVVIANMLSGYPLNVAIEPA